MIVMLTACGGSSDKASPSKAEPILVNAGENISLNETETASITGGSSGGTGAITYTWQAPDGVQIEHTDTTQTNAIITAPLVSQPSEYTITLRATDETGAQQSASFVLSVSPVNILPIAVINTNQISDYASLNYPATSTIQLSGSNSTDEDPQSSQAPISAYLWQQIAGPNLLTGIDTSLATIELITPILSTNQTAIFRLTVSDQEQASSSQDISLTLLAQSNTIPQAEITSIRDVFAGEIVSLNGSASSIAPDAGPFSANWSSLNGALIQAPNAFATYATAPLVSQSTNVTYMLEIEDSFLNTVSTQASALVFAPNTRYINDTGVMGFANQNSVLTQYQQGFPGQDANFGADRQAVSGYVDKVGDGEAGFDFTRLDSNGDAVDNPSFAFNCVRDNVTGLIWQIKNNTSASSIEHVDQKFTWFSEDENGNFEGDLNASSTSCNTANSQCNTQDYVTQINSQGMCGFYDWRLPNLYELMSIVNYGKSTPPLVDTVFFPYWGGTNSSQPSWHWTGQSSADGVSDDIARNAWAVDMNSGTDGFLDKTTEQNIILVRAGR